MEKYSARWRATIFAAIVLHVVTALAFSFVAPYLTPAPKIQEVVEIEWLDVEISDEAISFEEETIPAEAPSSKPLFNAEDLIVPETVIPELVVPPIELPPPPQIKPRERPERQTPPVEQPVKPEEPAPQNGNQLLTKPPVVLNQVYPEKSDAGDFKGYVSFAARIGKDGKVKSTEILQSSGDKRVDDVAAKAARQWTFRPALDQIGRPMECDTIITFDFKKLK